MKLNKKGWSKAEKYLCPECWKDTNWERPNEPEFKQDDFQYAVILTIEEAKEIAVTMFAYHKFCQKFLSGVNDNFLIKASKVNHILDKRIEKTEVQDEIK